MLIFFWSQGGTTPPTPAPGGIGHGGDRKRRYIVRSDGRRYEIDHPDDMRRVVEDILKSRAPEKKAKKSRKIKRVEKPSPGILLQEFRAWDALEAELALMAGLIEERLLIDMMLAILVREAIRQDDEEVMLLLEMMT